MFYAKDKFDIERYERIREISAEMISYKTEISTEKVQNLFCSDVGYQTPKIDTRAAIFKDGKILLVHEANGTWSLPGGWCDVDISVEENTIKEVKEESGLDVTVKRVIAVQDREKHNLPIYAYKVCKIFMQCEVTGGQFKTNIETTGFDYFGIDDLPELAEEKNNKEQSERKSKIGSGDRSEKIRTYNYPQNRVTDHRINFSIMELDRVMDGYLDPIIEALINEDMRLKLEGIK